MQQILPLVPIAIFFVVLLLVGYVYSYRANRALHFKKEYFLGSQNLGGIVLAMTLVATYGSVSSFISGPGVAWNLGLGWVVFAAPQIITAFLILGVLAKRMTILTHRLDSLTVIDLLYERFHSKVISLLLAIMLIVFFLAMIVGQFLLPCHDCGPIYRWSSDLCWPDGDRLQLWSCDLCPRHRPLLLWRLPRCSHH